MNPNNSALQSTHSCASTSVSVVIPTLGGAQLAATLTQLNNGSILPEEVLICVPNSYVERVQCLCFDNVHIVSTECKGQVGQRAAGFKLTRSKFVLQLDDDVLLDERALESLIQALTTLGAGHVVGPVFYNAQSGLPLTQLNNGLKGVFVNVYESLIRGLPWGEKRMGAVSNTGACAGVDPSYCRAEIHNSSWLPGGCVLSYRENVLTEQFYPYQGKAYSEDVLNSHLRTQNGIGHHVILSAKATIQPPERKVTLESAVSEIKARSYVAHVMGGNALYALIAALADIIRRQVAGLLK